jgi:hypothetical protein
MQSCGQHRAATIGVIQMSPMRWRDARRLEDQSDRPERDRWTAEIGV